MKNTLQYSRQYRLLHKDKLNAASKRWRERNQEKIKEYSKIRRQTVKYKFGRYQERAKKKEISFKLSLAQFDYITSQPCHYCNFKEKRVGIDRKNNNLGYIISNSLPCCWECNKFKRTLDYDFFLKKCIQISKTGSRDK